MRRIGLVVVFALTLLGGAAGIYLLRPVRPPPTEPEPEARVRGRALYAKLCAGCHGEKGDAQSPASAFLEPRPRPFADLRFRFGTTHNAVPTDDDLRRLLDEGLPPGMFAYPQLTPAERDDLIGYYRYLTKEGVAARLRQQAAEEGDNVDEATLRHKVERLTTPGAVVAIPETLPAATPASVARGAALYRVGCAVCHGATGKGEGAPPLRNDDGTAARLPDLTRGQFKGGSEPRRLYARVVLGLPGSPMPGSAYLSPEQVGDVVHYVRSLAPGGRPLR